GHNRNLAIQQQVAGFSIVVFHGARDAVFQEAKVHGVVGAGGLLPLQVGVADVVGAQAHGRHAVVGVLQQRTARDGAEGLIADVPAHGHRGEGGVLAGVGPENRRAIAPGRGREEVAAIVVVVDARHLRHQRPALAVRAEGRRDATRP
nr:hypothetical protein [Tanacetum cinerariifolium]